MRDCSCSASALQGVLLFATLAVLFSSLSVAAAEKRRFDIAAGEAAHALNEFSRQAELQIYFDADAVRRFMTNAVAGEFEAAAALSKMLGGTGLAFEFVNERTIAIMPAARGGPVIKMAMGQGSDDLGFGVASAGDTRAAGTEGNQQSSESSSAENDSDVATRNAADEEEQVIVVGTRISGERPVGSTVQTYDRKAIAASGAGTLAEFARRIPQNYANVGHMNQGPGSFGGAPQGGSNSTNATAFNLRGLGAEATLTLVDGNRVASSGSFGGFTDISLIPFGAVERVEVLADGASALYGADAIAGVVNVVLRKDFTGAESTVRYGALDGGEGSHFTASQLLGTRWDTGGAMLVYEYDDHDRVRATELSFIPPLGVVQLIKPSDRRNSASLRTHQQLGEGFELTADASYSERITLSELQTTPTANRSEIETAGEQYAGSIGLAADVFGAWQMDLTGTWSRTDQVNDTLTPAISQLVHSDWRNDLTTGRLEFNGPLFRLRAEHVKAAVGLEYRHETYESRSLITVGGVPRPPTARDGKRDVSGAFVELLVPLISESDGIPGASRLVLSASGRYDDYEDVGSTTNPKLGLAWSPIRSVTVRSSYGTSFRAPSVFQLVDEPAYIIFPLANPMAPPTTNTIIISGQGNSLLNPETARTLSASLEFAPTGLPGFEVIARYFDTEYEDRLALPPIVGGNPFNVWLQFDALASFIDTSPDPAEVNAIYTSGRPIVNPMGIPASAVQAIFDFRPQNIAVSRESGVDAFLKWSTAIGRGAFGVDLNATYILEAEFQPSTLRPPVDINDKVGQPAAFSSRLGLSWQGPAVSSYLFINHVADYENPLVTPVQSIDSWTTVDLQISYTTADRVSSSLLRDFTGSLSIENLTDEDPPFVQYPAGVAPLSYDGRNASPLGRVMSLRLTKSW